VVPVRVAEIKKTRVNTPLPGSPVSATFHSFSPMRIACHASQRTLEATL
jgi:hypothetical protein